MKVLVVDDNIAIQEILRDILNNDGHLVRIAGSIDEAVGQILDFRPDAILLDTLINDEDGVQILSMAYAKDHDINLDTVLIKGMNEEAPMDNPSIKAVVNKPFKSSDISAALNILVARKEQEELAKNSSSKKGILGFIKRKKNKDDDQKSHLAVDEEAIIADYIINEGPMFGRSYVFFEKEPYRIYDFVGIFDSREYSVMIVSSENSKSLKQTLNREDIEVISLSSSGRGKSMEITALGTLTVLIKDFIREHDKPIVIIDNFTDIIDNNSLNQSLVFIDQLIKSKAEIRPSTVLVSVDPSMLTTKDRNILLGDLYEYSN